MAQQQAGQPAAVRVGTENGGWCQPKTGSGEPRADQVLDPHTEHKSD
jgi:hypothetical protein